MSWEIGNQKSRNKDKDINNLILSKEGFLDEREAKILLYRFLKENPSFASELLTGVELFPFQHMAIKAMFNTDYFLGVWSRGLSKSFTTGIFAILDAIMNQGVHIGIISKSFRQAKMIFRKIEDISKTIKASMFAETIGRVSRGNDEWFMEIGSSRITALPLGDGEKLRGFRFQRMIIDEFLLMPEKIFNEVIVPFLSVVENPTERQNIYNMESKMIAEGKMKEDERMIWPNNKIIALSSASYKFEYLYKLYQEYESLIRKGDTKAHRVIMHFSYDCAPSQLYDGALLNQAKATMSESQFQREFGSLFTDDSSGYFKVSKMMACTIPDGEGQSVEVAGDAGSKYILAFDPSWSESDGSDDFAMQVIKLVPDKRVGVLVHSYAMAGANLKSHMDYFYFLLKNFNIVAIVGDYNGGVQFLNSVNESEQFKKEKIKIETFDADFENLQDYNDAIKDCKNQYNISTRRICHLRKPTSSWIRFANELLQSAFDHKKLLFAGGAINDSYTKQRSKNIELDKIKFSKGEDEKEMGAKMIDFIEHQKDMLDLTKAECALIQPSSTATGTQTFDLPTNLKGQRGADRARKDSYSALVLGNWMLNVYLDMMDAPEAQPFTFVPMFIK